MQTLFKIKMVAKIGRGQNLYGVLSYNQRKVDLGKGAVLSCHNMPIGIEPKNQFSLLMRFFEPYLIANQKTEKPILHISLNPDPNDLLSDEHFQQLAKSYMEKMGYGNQPYVVFRHSDIERSHIHIVSVCTDESGKKIDDSFEHMRSMKVCRKLEQEYKLRPATEKKNNEQSMAAFHPVDYRKNDLKGQIASVVRYLPQHYKFQTLGEYNALLSLFNITAEKVEGPLNGIQRKGLVYFALNENGVKTTHPFKASLFGKSAGYEAIHINMAQTQSESNERNEKTVLVRAIGIALTQSANEKEFKDVLLQNAISLVVRRNEAGRIYGITFIDHNTRTVWNGSRLSKQLSANVFNEWWNNKGNKPDLKLSTDSRNTEQGRSSNRSTGSNESKPTATSSFNLVENDFGGIFSFLFPEVQDVDYAEEAFTHEMQKKRKKKRNRKS